MTSTAGWLFLVGGTAGQRGIMAIDVSSEANQGVSAVISPVKQELPGTLLEAIFTLEELHDVTGNLNFWIRSSFANDSTFDSANIPTPANNNGWTRLYTSQDLNNTSIGPYYQICVTYQVVSLDTQTPAQIIDIEYVVNPPGEPSDNWASDVDNSTQGTSSPSYAAWYLASTYTTSVPTLYARVQDSTGTTIFSANTASNPTLFEYSTDGGTNWISLGTIPNVVGTRVRALVSPVPAAEAFVSIREF
jgi:hypothetical protein